MRLKRQKPSSNERGVIGSVASLIWTMPLVTNENRARHAERLRLVVSKPRSSQNKNNARTVRVLSLTVRPSLPEPRPTEVIGWPSLLLRCMGRQLMP